MPSDRRYWFRRGKPIMWQGWLVFATWLVLVVAGVVLHVFLFPPRRSLATYLIAYNLYVAVLSE